MQELATNVKMLNALLTDYSPIFRSFQNLRNIYRGCSLWKFCNSLISYTNFVDQMKALIQKVIFSLEKGTYLTDQVKWKLLKYEIRKFTVCSARALAQNFRKLQTNLETKIKNLQQNITDQDKFKEHNTAKDELENLYKTLLLESKFEVNAIVINTVKNLLNMFEIWKKL